MFFADFQTLAMVVFADFQSLRTLSPMTIFVPFSMVRRKIPKIDHFFQL